jgi:hypothetical protein
MIFLDTIVNNRVCGNPVFYLFIFAIDYFHVYEPSDSGDDLNLWSDDCFVFDRPTSLGKFLE